MIYSDRTRYLTGYDCPWRRLLGFHAFGTGITRRTLSPPLSTGTAVHRGLEGVLARLPSSVSQPPPTPADVDNAARAAELAYIESFTKSAGWSIDPDPHRLKTQLTIVSGLVHGWSRCVLPWLNQAFEVKEIEAECSFEVAPNLIWMARPDFVAVDRVSGLFSIHDFKTTSYWSDSQLPEWADSIQMMLNAEAVRRSRGWPVESYYIHILIKGSKDHPSRITHPWYRPAIPPYQPESWRSRYTRDPAYSRTLVTDVRSIGDWVWEMPEADLVKSFPVVGPFPVDNRKIAQFLRGLPLNEEDWVMRTVNLDWKRWPMVDFQQALDKNFPRTFRCYTYGERCPFYALCFKHPGWQDPLSSGYQPRQPHHPQEILPTRQKDDDGLVSNPSA